MTNLENLDKMLIDHYVETINNFIGGEPALEVTNYDVNKDAVEFIYRLATTIQEKNRQNENILPCLRKCPFRR